jgi:hypothetical protein
MAAARFGVAFEIRFPEKPTSLPNRRAALFLAARKR